MRLKLCLLLLSLILLEACFAVKRCWPSWETVKREEFVINCTWEL